MALESIGEEIPQKVLDLVTSVLGNDATIESTDGDYLSLRIHFSVNNSPVVLDIVMTAIDEVTGEIDYEFSNIAIPGDDNLFANPVWQDRFCQWGMEFERGRLVMLRSRLAGVLDNSATLSAVGSPDSQFAVDRDATSSVVQLERVVPEMLETLNGPPSDIVFRIPKDIVFHLEGSVKDWRNLFRATIGGCFIVCCALGIGAIRGYSSIKRDARQTDTLVAAPIPHPVVSVTPPIPPVVILSPQLSPSLTCPVVVSTAIGIEHGLLPWLRRIKHDHPIFFSTNHLMPQDLVVATIHPRHRAEAAAHASTSHLHMLGEQHQYHFGQVVPGDQIFLQACPHLPVTMTYYRGTVPLYTVQVNR